jgi:hypothetical protein
MVKVDDGRLLIEFCRWYNCAGLNLPHVYSNPENFITQLTITSIAGFNSTMSHIVKANPLPFKYLS